MVPFAGRVPQVPRPRPAALPRRRRNGGHLLDNHTGSGGGHLRTCGALLPRFRGKVSAQRRRAPCDLEAYRTAIPCIAVSPHLAALVREEFGRPARVVPPCLERFWRPTWRRHPGRPARITVLGPFENRWKGVATALEAVRTLRGRGTPCRLVRVSPWPLSAEESALATPDEYHERVVPRTVARILRSADVLLAPSWEQEGFGLPVLEAMASGLPVVASDISAFRAYAGTTAVLVPPDRPEAFAEAAQAILGDPARWRAMRRRGLEAARCFSERRVTKIAEEALYWVAEGHWREEA